MAKPIVLHLGDDIKWNHDLYEKFQESFDIARSHSMNREEFKTALQDKAFGDFFAIYRPFWNTGGEMGHWDDELISLLPKSCRIYASAGAGYDWVDTARLGESNIIYCNAASACTESAADGALYLILNAFRRFTLSSLAARSLESDQFTAATRTIPAATHNPGGHVLGIIGFGRIGLRIAQKVHGALGMVIHYYDLMQKNTEVTVNAKYIANMDDLLATSDCVVLAAPYRGKVVMSREHFFKMKKGSRFINIARGKLISEDGLADALESGHLFAAGLDVHSNEPHVNPRFAKMSNVELQCHIAGGSVESHMGFERMGMENILSFYKNGTPISPVNMHLVDSSRL